MDIETLRSAVNTCILTRTVKRHIHNCRHKARAIAAHSRLAPLICEASAFPKMIIRVESTLFTGYHQFGERKLHLQRPQTIPVYPLLATNSLVCRLWKPNPLSSRTTRPLYDRTMTVCGAGGKATKSFNARKTFINASKLPIGFHRQAQRRNL
jgi:hypothetical protein